MTTMSAGAEASLRAAASPANPAPTITTLRELELESGCGFIDRPAADAAIYVLCRLPLTGQTFESSKTTDGNRQLRTLAAKRRLFEWDLFLAPSRLPTCRRAAQLEQNLAEYRFAAAYSRHVRTATLTGPSSMYWSTVLLPSKRRRLSAR